MMIRILNTCAFVSKDNSVLYMNSNIPPILN